MIALAEAVSGSAQQAEAGLRSGHDQAEAAPRGPGRVATGQLSGAL